MTENETIELALACNLGRTMKPIGMNAGDVFVTDRSYRTAELFAFADAVRAAERERILDTLKRHYWHANNIIRYYYPSATNEYIDLRELRKVLAPNAVVNGGTSVSTES